ncbi:SDR family NAD(P)-dependent oxidoreductase [Yunchengibacter salinarum]|uniref:SDR family NAD(P)-dependent oxidoreductase n=1 Tax=Yunchengibacter salinarum TaxID=3133399 RepID=UPI0035B6396B
MDLGLAGKRVLITGATRGIGAAVMDCMIAEGARVAFCAREEAGVIARQDALRGHGHDVTGTTLDVKDTESYLQWIEDSAAHLGGVDVFIPNVSAGAGQGEEAWRANFDVDLMATVRGAEATLDHMAADGGGSIVVLASISPLEAMGGPAPYNSMKAALITYASQLGDVAAGYGVRVNAVSPGPIHIEDGFWGQTRREHPQNYEMVRARQPFGRLGTPEEVGRAITFLASPAASWITRANLVVDGGFLQRTQF